MKNIKKRLIGWTLGLALSLGVGIGIASNAHSEIAGVEAAGEASVATLKFPDENKAINKLGSYEKPWEAKIGTNTWSIENFNNNNWNNWTYIKCGRKRVASVATITNTTPLKGVSEIALEIGRITKKNVNSIYLQCGKTNTEFTESKITIDPLTEGTYSFKIGSSDFSFFKLTFDCKAGSENGIVQVNSVDYSKVVEENASADALAFGTSFLNNTATACADGTKDNSEALKTTWTALKTEFSALSDGAKKVVKDAVANNAGTDLEKAMARYDHIVKRYSVAHTEINDFIGRGVATSLTNKLFKANTTNNVMVISLIACASVAAIGGFYFIRKRKEQN